MLRRPDLERRAAAAVGPFPGLTIGAVRSAADDLLELMPQRTRRIVVERFGVVSGEPRTLVDIGRAEGVSRERIRQIVDAGFALLRQRFTPTPKSASAAGTSLVELLANLGGVASEGTILAVVGSPGGREQAALRMLLTSLPLFTEARETQRTYAHWVLVRSEEMAENPDARQAAGLTTRDVSLESVLESAERVLEDARSVMPEDRFVAAILENLQAALPPAVLHSFLALSTRIARNPLGDYGLRVWREVVPRSVGDKAYLVLRAKGKPVHFRDVAAEINRLGFDLKRALPETVHNELIRDARFVLVGRGLYALQAWGFTRGKVSDLIVSLLTASGRPLPKAEIVEAVLKERLVKRNTVLMSLQNRSLFQRLPDGTYVLAPPREPVSVPRRGSLPASAPGHTP